MAKDEIPVRAMIKNAVEDLGGKANKQQIINWINEHHNDVNEQTIVDHLYSLSVNVVSRIHHGRNKKARSFNADYDVLFKKGNEFEIYDDTKHGNYELIEVDGKTVVAKDGIPISNDASSPLLKFLKDDMEMKANYQPIVIKTLLEKGNEGTFSATVDEIKDKIQELNFERKNFLNDAINAVSKALKKFVTFGGENVSLHLDQFSHQDISKCLKICGQEIARWHINKITNNEFNVWSIMPGSTKEEFPYLDEFLKTNSIGVGWSEVGDVSNFDEEKIRQEFNKQYEEDDGSFVDFIRIQQKDFVVLTRGQQEIIDFGIIVSDYQHQNVKFPSYPHRKGVVWLNQGPINANELPNPTLAGFVTTCGRLVKRKQEMIQVLIGKQNLAAIKAHSWFILIQNPGTGYDDIVGKQYQYDNHKANYTQLDVDSKFVIQSKINNENYFIGFGRIGSIETSSNTNEDGNLTKLVAKFSEYEKFEEPVIRTNEILNEMKTMKEYGNQPPSILPITRKLFKKITGQDLDDEDQITSMSSEYSKIIQVLKRKKNIILYGPPGTGKTFTAKILAKLITKDNSNNLGNRRHTWKTVTTLVLLENNGKPLNYHEVSKRALEKDLVKTSGITPHETIAKIMRDDIQERGENSFFIKPSDGMYGLNVPTTFEKAAELILFAENKPMHYSEITKIALEKQIINSQGDTPEKSLLAEMTKNIQENGENSAFVQTSDGTYALRHKNPVSSDELDESEEFIENVTFHQSYGYEEFIEGIRPKPTESGITYPIVPGIFQEFCEQAKSNLKQNYVMIIDEINRGNISKIFGELITIMENDKRGDVVKLAYSKKSFSVPKNLYIIGTMNTADQSLTHIDAALKRRFSSVEIMPNSSILKGTISGISLPELLEKINEKILEHSTRDNQIGHSYFMDEKGESIKDIKDLQFIFATDIIPLLRDYFYDNDDALKDILNEQFIEWDKPGKDVKDDWQENVQTFLDAIKAAYFKK